MIALLLILLSAHILGDFLLQTDGMVRKKKGFFGQALHAGIHALLAYVFVGLWLEWKLPAIIFITHMLIDVIKVRSKNNLCNFVFDQLLHVAVIVCIGCFMQLCPAWPVRVDRVLVFAAGWAAAVNMAKYVITLVSEPYYHQVECEYAGLANGGAIIGQLERTLIYILVMVGQPGGIGFLVAAKSILRFEEAKKQQLGEYILIGTLLSFTSGILIAYAARWAVGQFSL